MNKQHYEKRKTDNPVFNSLDDKTDTCRDRGMHFFKGAIPFRNPDAFSAALSELVFCGMPTRGGAVA